MKNHEHDLQDAEVPEDARFFVEEPELDDEGDAPVEMRLLLDRVQAARSWGA